MMKDNFFRSICTYGENVVSRVFFFYQNLMHFQYFPDCVFLYFGSRFRFDVEKQSKFMLMQF